MNPIHAAILAPFLIALVLSLTIALNLIVAIPLLYAWNYVMPIVFHLPTITYWQSFALLVVSTILVKSLPSSGK